MSLTVLLGATLTGGVSTVLASSGLSAGGKASFVAPDHTLLEPRVVDIFVTKPTTTTADPGVARSGLKVAYASRTTESGCCNVNAGTIIADVAFRWPLSQPEAVVDDAIAMLRALVYTQEFADAIKSGILPS
jgi:hypothetical protein